LNRVIMGSQVPTRGTKHDEDVDVLRHPLLQYSE